jgi:hypothetical protein
MATAADRCTPTFRCLASLSSGRVTPLDMIASLYSRRPSTMALLADKKTNTQTRRIEGGHCLAGIWESVLVAVVAPRT